MLVGPTNDGGAHFAPLTSVASWPCSSNAPAASLAFDDHGDGFLYGPDLFVTHDRGLSWAAEPQAGTVLSVEALGYSVWMLEAECPDTLQALAKCPLQLVESSNGGVSWQLSPSPPPTAADGGTGGVAQEGALGQSWLVRTTASFAYIVSNPAANSDGTPDAAPLFFTADGGVSWTTEELPCGLDALSVVLAAAPDGSLMAVCAGQPGAGNQAKAVSRSFDHGATWTVYPACNPRTQVCSTPPQTPLDSGYLGEVDAVSANTAFLAGGRSLLLVTHDGGVDWQPIGSIGDVDGGPSQVIFFNSEQGISLGDDVIWSTTDGGEDWSAVTPSW